MSLLVLRLFYNKEGLIGVLSYIDTEVRTYPCHKDARVSLPKDNFRQNQPRFLLLFKMPYLAPDDIKRMLHVSDLGRVLAS